jgi:hypothetical protein
VKICYQYIPSELCKQTRKRRFNIRPDAITAVIMKSTILWVASLCSSERVRRFGEHVTISSTLKGSRAKSEIMLYYLSTHFVWLPYPEDRGNMFLRNVRVSKNYKTLKSRIPFSDLIAVQIVILKNGVFWEVTPCGSCKNWRFTGK